MRIRVLGAVETEQDGRTSPITSPTQRIVLARLVAARDESVPTDALVDAIWGDDPPVSAVGSLHAYVSRLRKPLGPALVRTSGGYQLVAPAADVDAWHFCDLLTRADDAADGTARLERLQEALNCWRGAPFADAADRAGVRPEAIRLSREHERAVARLGETLIADGDHQRAIGVLEGALVDNSLDERLWALLVTALAGASRTADALRAYQRAVRELAEAGLEPPDELRAIERRVIAPAPAGAPVESVAPSAATPTAASTAFIGRDADLRALASLHPGEPLVTVLGPGGVGKSRLVSELVRRDPIAGHRVAVIDLSPLGDAAGLAEIVLDALGAGRDGETDDALTRLASTPNTIVLDNCEHLVGEAARVAALLCPPGGTAHVIATSRERLAIGDEFVYELAPLRSGATGAGRELFRDRAARAGHRIADDDLPLVDRLIERLDGLPLAIEMAAARTRTRSLPELLCALDDRAAALTSPARHADPRHRSLLDVVGWSHDLLDEDEATLYAELSVFAGSPSVDEVARVTGRDREPVAGRLESLCDRSLVVARPGVPTRFGMLQTVRDHARRELRERGRADELTEAHARWFARFAVEQRSRVFTAAEGAALDAVEQGLDELRAAHRWALGSDPDLAADLVIALYDVAQIRLRLEIHAWASATVAVVDDPARRQMLEVVIAAGEALVGDVDHAWARLDAIGAPSSEATWVGLLEVRSDILLFRGDVDETVRVSTELRDAAQAGHDRWREIVGVVNVAIARSYRNEVDAALAGIDAARAADDTGSSTLAGWLAYARGEVLLDRDPSTALVELDWATAAARSSGNRYLVGVAEVSAVSLRARVGDPASAIAPFAGLIHEWQRRGDWIHQLTALRNLVPLLHRLDDDAGAATLLAAVTRTGLPPTFGDEAARLNDVRQHLARALDATDLEHHTADGQAFDVDDTIAFALDRLARHGP